MQNRTNTIAIYSRKSRFTGKGESIENQVELCKDYLRVRYGETCENQIIIYEDEGFSGSNLDRPGFQRMLKTARARQIQAIVVYRLDRISRNISDFSGLIEELNRLEIAFISVREQFDTSTPMGRAMMYIASVFSQLERETIAERIRDNMRELAKTGRWLGGTTPTGYGAETVEYIAKNGKVKRVCQLKLEPEEARQVQQIYRLFVKTHSLTATEAELLRQHIKTKTGRNYTRFSIKAILQNPVYVIAERETYDYFIEKAAAVVPALEAFDGVRGILAYNRTEQKKGQTTVYLPVQQWIISVGQHPGLIPARTWIQVQGILEQNKSKAYRHPRSNEALLTGKLFCRCGNRMYPKLTNRSTGDGKPVYTYICSLKERSRKVQCDCRNVNGNRLDAIVIQQIRMLPRDPAYLIAQLQQYRQHWVRIQRSLEQKPALQTAQVEMEGADSTRLEKERDTICRSLLCYEQSIENLDLKQKRIAVRALLQNVVWDGEQAHIVLLGASENIGKQLQKGKPESFASCDRDKNDLCEDSK